MLAHLLVVGYEVRVVVAVVVDEDEDDVDRSREDVLVAAIDVIGKLVDSDAGRAKKRHTQDGRVGLRILDVEGSPGRIHKTSGVNSFINNQLYAFCCVAVKI